MTNPTNRNESPEEEEGAVQLLSQDSTEVDLESPESNTNEENEQRPSPRARLAESLRAHTARLRIARVRGDFEQTLTTVLILNVIYMYYLDHKILVLIIRAFQLMRLLNFPYVTADSKGGTALILFISNLSVVLIHSILMGGPSAEVNIGDMLFINFIGPEPKSLDKTLGADAVIMTLQAMLLQSKWEWEGTFNSFPLVSVMPVPVTDSVPQTEPLEEDSDSDSDSHYAEYSAHITISASG